MKGQVGGRPWVGRQVAAGTLVKREDEGAKITDRRRLTSKDNGKAQTHCKCMGKNPTIVLLVE